MDNNFKISHVNFNHFSPVNIDKNPHDKKNRTNSKNNNKKTKKNEDVSLEINSKKDDIVINNGIGKYIDIKL